MPRPQTLRRMLLAALAIVALAAPAAVARPIDSTVHNHAAASERAQDLGHLNAGGKLGTSSLAGTTEADLADGGAVYWSYDHPAPIPNTQDASADDGTPWMTIGIGVAGACFLVATATALGTRFRSRRVAA